jgi:serine/threonine protein kinase
MSYFSIRLRAEVFDSQLRDVPESAYELLDRCLDPNPYTRITADQALEHPFLAT